jgi:hypothetical protein
LPGRLQSVQAAGFVRNQRPTSSECAAPAPARGADHKNLELPLLISFSGFALGAGGDAA